jgi:hypothetical protein
LRQEVVGDLAQSPVQHVRNLLDVGAGPFADDGANGIDMLIDERERNALHVRRMLNQAAKTIRGRRDEGITECRCLALDVMGGVKQRVARRFREPPGLDVSAGDIEAVAFRIHPR